MNLRINILALSCLLLGYSHFGSAQGAEHDHPEKTGSPAFDDRVPIKVSDQAQSGVGLKTHTATRETLTHVLRTVGSVTTDQTNEARIAMRISGWIEKIYVDYVGKAVKKGDPLFDLYSPELVSTQEEYLAAVRQHDPLAQEVARYAQERLRFWGVSNAEIAKLAARGKAQRTLTFYAPVDGIVLRKSAILGSYVTPDTELYYLANLKKVWLLITLYESDVSLIQAGDVVDVSLPYDKAKHYTGSINYIFPELDPETRTVKARVEISNEDGFLRPGMFADIDIKKSLPDRLMVPDDAIINTGVRNLVFVKADNETFTPREVMVGPRISGKTTILSGLEEGEAVVVSAGFLIDSESRTQAALRKGKASASGHGDHGKK